MVKTAMAETERGAAGRLAELYLHHAPGATRLAYLLTGDRALAEDLVQDAFVRLARRLVHLRRAEAFDAYLRKTVVNLANSYFRRKRVERGFLQREAGLRGAHTILPDLASRDELRRALLRLPPRQRAAVVLRFYEDLSEQQTAEVLRCAPGTVKSLASRGLERLREAMAGE